MSKRRTLYLALLLLATGCATPAPGFKQPQSGPSAEIVFVAETPGANLGVAHLHGNMDGCACSTEPTEIIGIFYNAAVLVPGSSSYADKGVSTNRFSVRVPADGKEFRFVLGAPRYRVGITKIDFNYCQAHQSFVPQPDKVYEAVFNEYKAPCAFTVFEVEQGRRARALPTQAYPMCALRPDNNDGISNQIRKYCAEHPQLYKSLPQQRM